MSKIAHIADIHIRLLKRHKEYRKIIDNLVISLKENNVDTIVIAGDVFHNKVNLSPEALELSGYFFQELSDIASMHIIVGNHDCIVNQPGRLDAITPSLKYVNMHNCISLYTKSGIYYDDNLKIGFGVFAINDDNNFPIHIEKKHDDYTYVALFHGAINRAKTDVDYVLRTKHNIKMFEEYDYAMLGDIHKYQVLGPGIAYPGSLIQQNFGEALVKGYIIWDTESGKSEFINVKNEYGYYTVEFNGDKIENIETYVKSINRATIPDRPFVRVLVKGEEYNHIKLQNLASIIKEVWRPVSLTIEVDINSSKGSIDMRVLEVENVSKLHVQHKLIRAWFKETDLKEDEINKMLNIHTEIFSTTVTDENQNRGSNWNVHRMNFSNTFSYGKDNFIDFGSLNGLVGIFAPNRSGKSALLATLLNGLFNMSDRVSRTNLKDIINKNEFQSEIEIYFSVDNKEYVLRREIIRVGKNQESSRTVVNLWEIIAGEEIAISGESRVNETENLIRSMLGNFSDHRLTTFGMQGDLNAFLRQNQALRKTVLGRFIGIDIIDALYMSVKAECHALKKLIKQYREHDFNSIYKNYVNEKKEIESELGKAIDLKNKINELIVETTSKINLLKSKLKNIEGEELNEDEITKFIKDAESSLQALEKEGESFNEESKSLDDVLKLVNDTINIYNEAVIKSNVEVLGQNKSQLNILNNEKLLNKKDISTYQRMSDNLRQHDWFETDEHCKQCIFLKDAFVARDKLENTKIQLDSLQSNIKSLNKEIEKHSSAEIEYKELVAYKNKRDETLSAIKINKLQSSNIIVKIETTKRELALNKEVLEKYKIDEYYIKMNNKIREEIASLDTDKDNLSNQIKEADTIISTQNVKLGSINQKIEDLGNSIKQLNEVEESFKLASILSEALSKDGIQLEIIKKIIPRVNLEIRKILSNLDDFDIVLDIDNDSQDVNIYIEDNIGRRTLELGSGMEQTIGSIAFRAAIANVSLVPRCNLFVIDEGFGSLDTENLNNMNMLLGYLKSIFDTVIIISHVDSMQDIVDHIVTIKKEDNGYSKLEIGE